MALVLDLSEAMLEKDMRPNRYIVALRCAQDFVREFFEQNPISQISVLAMHDGVAARVSELSGNPSEHVAAIAALRYPRNPRDLPREPKGSPSLQNALELARASLYHTPSHGTREVIIVLGALLSLDPGDIHATIRACARDRVRVAVVGLAGRLKICQEMVARTNGGDDSGYVVALDQPHFRELLLATTTPPVIRNTPSAATAPASLLMMGFPSRVAEPAPSLCACHGVPSRGGYSCSRCAAKLCALPASCPACGLTLILSTHLARSYHHLFPLRNWRPVSWRAARRAVRERGARQCAGCLAPFPEVPHGKGRGEDRAAAPTPAPAPAPASVSANGAAPSLDGDRGGGDGGRGGAGDGGAAANDEDSDDQRAGVQAASESSRYECGACGAHFCIDCDVFCHEVVHNCPGCLSGAGASGGAEAADGAADGADGIAEGVVEADVGGGRSRGRGKGKGKKVVGREDSGEVMDVG